MMKKLLSLFTLLLLFAATKATADPVELTDNMVVSQIGAAATSLDTDAWYLVWGDRSNGGGYIWDYGYKNSDEGYGELYQSYGSDVVYEGLPASDAAQYLIRFIPATVEGYDNAYIMQFATGNYVWFPNANQTALQSVPSIDDATPVYTYDMEGAGEGEFAFNSTDHDYQLNRQGAGAYVVTYTQGQDYHANSLWNLYPVTFEEASDYDLAYSACLSTYVEYRDYRDSFTTGTTYGCYGEEEVAAFQAALDAVAALDDVAPDEEPVVLSVEELQALRQAIIDTYDAVIASLIPYEMEVEEGYYFLKNGLDFYVDTTTESSEDPETGDIIPGETVRTHYTKAMYSQLNGDEIDALWDTFEESAPFLWKVTATDSDKEYELVNVATDATFNTVSTSANVTMTTDIENHTVFDYYGVSEEDENTTLVNIRLSTQDADGQYYLHCGGHDNGLGTSGSIVGWGKYAGASHWILEPVSEEVAEALIEAYAPIKDSEQRYQQAQAMIDDAEAKMVIATDASISNEGLITSVEQLSSPDTCPVEGQGEDIAALIDGDTETFWQSNWHYDEAPEVGSQYFQVELNEAVEEDIVFTFTRRENSGNNITLWGVYGSTSTSEDVSKEACTLLAEISTPYTTLGETLTSEAFSTQGFTVLRFYIEGTSGGSYFTHLAEFQLYTTSANPSSQRVALGSVYTDLEAAVAEAKAEGEDITADTYSSLKQAYDAFIALFVDPTELRGALANAEEAVGSIVVGTNPGEWSSEESASALQAVIASATSYDGSGKYTQAESDTYVSQLEAGIEAITEAANKVEEGKWYRLRYATEAEMTEHGWTLSNGAASGASPELYGKYACASNLNQEDEESWLVEPLTTRDLDDACLGQQVHFASAEDISQASEDDALFRFVSVGDSAYLLQNKATGLFLKASGTSGTVSLSIQPTLFTTKALGYGQSLVSGQRLDGESCANLHAQLNSNVLVTWSASEAGSNSGLYIEDAGEVAADYDGSAFNMSLQAGVIYAQCWAVDVTAEEGTLYGVQSVDETVVTLAPMEGNTAPAGTPFFYIYGTTDDYDQDEVADIVSFSHGMGVAREALTYGKAVGSYYGETIGQGKLIASLNELTVSKSGATVAENSVYIDGSYTSGSTIVIEYTDETYDSVEEVLGAVARTGSIYTIDGRLVGKGGITEAKRLGKGVYIVGGAKVMVR